MLFRRIATVLGLTGTLLLPAAAAQADPDVSSPDAGYLVAAHQVNLAEIAAGRIAFTKSADRGIKDIAVTFIRDHIVMDAKLTQVARELRVSLPTAPTEEQQALARRYQAAGTDTFDEYFVATQLAAHRESLKKTRTAAAESDNAEVRELAAGAAPVIASHHGKLRAQAAAENMVGYTQGGRHHD
ncbi:DUF4142 domain-containing protein [Actinoplanes sp. DH11]|uniref:DUF4142 domain-containing protein n=1 Tax=Actinoplanes sp. DH11 TaxID=2857011 RepID=UPI001E355996|nr:DUF4142 domain-containing protein [Actinoplanes sp. DH11]